MKELDAGKVKTYDSMDELWNEIDNGYRECYIKPDWLLIYRITS